MAWSVAYPAHQRESPSMPFQFVTAGEFGEFFMRLGLVPESHGCNVILQREVTPARLPAEILNSDFEIVLEADGVGNVPAIKAEAPLQIGPSVRLNDLGQ